jgi:hypothetical protein
MQKNRYVKFLAAAGLTVCDTHTEAAIRGDFTH